MSRFNLVSFPLFVVMAHLGLRARWLLVGVIVSICQSMGYGSLAQAIVYAMVFLIFLFRPTGIVKAQWQ